MDMYNWKMWKYARGLTLIEILLTTVFLSVAFLGIGAMTFGSIHRLVFSDHMTTGITLAKERIKQIRHADYTAVINANFPHESYGSIAGYEAFQRDVVIVDDTPETHMKTVTVTVSWREVSGDAKDVVVSTIVAE